MKAAYLDASAAVKLIRSERESQALEEAVRQEAALVSSELLAVELRCTALRIGTAGLLARADDTLQLFELVKYTTAIGERAAQEFDPLLRTLDAIHAATALALAEDLGVVYVYDLELKKALQNEGLEVASPGLGS